jgi:hypothetical protein
MVLGPLMIILATAWFGGMSWAGMHEDERPRRHTEVALVGAPAPWWTNDGFTDTPVTELPDRQPIPAPATAGRGEEAAA